LKVLVVGQFIEPPFSEGKVNTVLNWSKALCDAGVDITIFSLSSKYSGYKKIFDIDFEYVKTKNPRFQENLADLFALHLEIINQSQEFDVIHFASNADGISSIPMLTLLKFNKNKIVNSYHNNRLNKSTFLLRKLLLDMITVPSKQIFNSFLQNKVSLEKMRKISSCVNTEVFKPIDRLKAREKLGLSEDSFLIFTTGHFRRGRRLIPLIQMVSELAKEQKNIQLLIGWTGHGEVDQIKKIFSIIKKTEFVEIIPPISYINLYYNAADVYILSARSEYVINAPMSLIEALSSGTPAISFDINAASEIIRNDVNGYLIKDGDFNEIKITLKYLMDNENILKDFSINARNTATNNFSYKVVGNQLSSLYRELVDN